MGMLGAVGTIGLFSPEALIGVFTARIEPFALGFVLWPTTIAAGVLTVLFVFGEAV